MRNTIRMIPMRGFTAAIERGAGLASANGAAAIAVGAEGEGEDIRVVLSMRHADGTTLSTHLSAASLDRLANLVADVVGIVPASEMGTVQ